MKQELTSLVPMIRRFAYSLTGSMADADDLLQSTVERVLSKKIPKDVDLNKWVFRVCRNLWIDEYRSRKVRQEAAQQPELSEGQIVDGERAIAGEMELERVNRAMDRLPNDQRSILALVALQGMSYKEVAATLEIPMGTVMSRLARARAALCEILNASPARAT
ncbi:RNA polymerase sigma factor [Microbulbifer rhizosphaerae]|uniref:RNA polymerase sigma-70 factor (ECF subfamily) n=1 Tax=Microbulbifer rhizosphaerae TaxID=1562603 RepID=A0A7W4WA65_9GAMM|nr:RNA polymerase sigma factor [Microbulbifer rhizosphaerae]MBB3060510.1 RNA polymerase sigma-70 factor (ECF subfamily) [Microbulbifer rhizosphaerae]